MLRIAICDDEEKMLDIVEKKVSSLIPEKGIQIETYQNANLLLQDVQTGKQCDLYLLDIEMSTMDGLELAKKIHARQDNADIIFLTSHEELAIQGYDRSIKAFHFVVKMQMDEKLPEVMDEWYVANQNKGKSYTIQTKVRFEKVFCSEILYIYKEGKNSVIVTKQRAYKERKTLENIFEAINIPDLIFIERGRIVNMEHVITIAQNCVVLDNGDQLEISQSHVTKVKKAVGEYWGSRL